MRRILVVWIALAAILSNRAIASDTVFDVNGFRQHMTIAEATQHANRGGMEMRESTLADRTAKRESFVVGGAGPAEDMIFFVQTV